MGRRLLTSAEVNQRIYAQGIKLVGDWKGKAALNGFACLECGHTWEAQGSGPVYAKSGCPKCNTFPYFTKLTDEEVRERLKPRGIELVGTWKGACKPNTFKCSIGHDDWETYGRGPLEGETGCPECYRLSTKGTMRRGRDW